MDVIGQVLHESSGKPAMVDPALLARRLTAVYRQWDREESVDLVGLAQAFLDRLGQKDDPLCRTCLQAADAVARWGGHEFHSVLHHAEVATNTMLIAELERWLGQPLDSHHALLLLASALGHDLYYDRSAAPAPPFELETKSARAVGEIADRCGVEPGDRRVLTCLILATEPSFRGCLRELLRGGCPERELPTSLLPITTEPVLAVLAAVLSDGDLLSSAGLTRQWHGVQVARLERERGKRMGARDDVEFLDGIVGPGFLSPGGRYFDPNLARLRARLDEGQTGDPVSRERS
jgi:hypothetical protein